MVALPIVIHDDRRRRRLLEKVKERDRCLSDLMDLLPGGVCIFVPDRNGRLQADFLNLGFYRMLGYAGAGQEALAWRDMTDWAHPKDRPGMPARRSSSAASATPEAFCISRWGGASVQAILSSSNRL